MEIPKPIYDEPKYKPARRTIPKYISDRLIKLGLNRQPGETARDQALRGKKWLKEHGGVLPDEVKSNLD